jgi:hypothetical protein
MTVLNFWPSWISWLPEEQRKDELFRLIRSGEKNTTIRPKSKTGKYYQLYYGKRGGKKELIAEVVPKGVSEIRIDSEKHEIYLCLGVDVMRLQLMRGLFGVISSLELIICMNGRSQLKEKIAVGVFRGLKNLSMKLVFVLNVIV